MKLRSLGLVIVVIVVSSCELPTEPLPTGAIPLNAQPIYRTWWNEVEACAGRNGDYDAIAWYEVPNSTVFQAGSTPNVEGYWQPYHHSITLAGLMLSDSLLVRHEELHAILHTTEHPAGYFDQKCSEIVYP